jgi:energy-coupling factor transporter ATP-binding protein EcfA2
MLTVDYGPTTLNESSLRMPVYLHGLALQFYRGIGPDMQTLAPFKEFNFFIGSNNSGKSTVLGCIYKFLPSDREQKLATFEALERYNGEKSGTPTMALGIPVEDFIEASLQKTQNEGKTHENLPRIRKIAEKLAEKGVVWIKGEIPASRNFQFLKSTEPSELRGSMIAWEWQHLWSHLTGRTSGDINAHWIPQSIATLLERQITSFPQVNLIPAIRQVGPKTDILTDFSGRGLISRLAEIQSPDHDKRHERNLFDRINKFLQTVTGRNSAQIEIPHNREHILVHMDNKVLPLSSLGTGIH